MGRLDHIAAYHMAIDLVKKAGFEFHHASQQTETCYYQHPSRKPFLLRLSTHKTKASPIGMNDVVARLTFGRKDMNLTNGSVISQVTYAIGRYFLTEPKPSRYMGKRGTWENEGKTEE